MRPKAGHHHQPPRVPRRDTVTIQASQGGTQSQPRRPKEGQADNQASQGGTRQTTKRPKEGHSRLPSDPRRVHPPNPGGNTSASPKRPKEGHTTSAQASQEWLNTLKVHNKAQLFDAIEKRPKDQGLVTVTNHHSCLDDPVLWGMLKIRYVMCQNSLRWTLAAEDVCFTKYWHALFFSLGKTVPVVRGAGVYQRSVDYMLEKLHLGEWVHMFPEGKVNETHQHMRLKWGVGRLISESNITPIVLPMFHFGMDDVLPNKKPYIPLIKKKVTVLIGKPIDFKEELDRLRELRKTPREIRKRVTDLIQEELSVLKVKAEALHDQHIQRER